MRILQLRIDIGDRAEVPDGGSERTHCRPSLRLERRGPGQDVRDRVRAHSNLALRQIERINERRQETSVGDRVQVDKVVRDAVPAADHGLAIPGVPSETETGTGIEVGFEIGAARVERA